MRVIKLHVSDFKFQDQQKIILWSFLIKFGLISAAIVLDLIKRRQANLKDGDTLNFTGMSSEQFRRIANALVNQGFNGTIKNGKKNDYEDDHENNSFLSSPTFRTILHWFIFYWWKISKE